MVSVHDKGNLLKRKKADSQRQKDIVKRHRAPKYRIHRGKKKVKILEIEQHAQVRRHRQGHDWAAFFIRQYPVKYVIAPDTARHNEQIRYVKIPVKPKRHGNQKNLSRPYLPKMHETVIAKKTARKK